MARNEIVIIAGKPLPAIRRGEQYAELSEFGEALTDEERATRETLRAELYRLEAEYADADELPDNLDRRLDEIETALIAFEERPLIYDPADIARAGAFVSIDSEGKLRIGRGYVNPEDEQPAQPTSPCRRARARREPRHGSSRLEADCRQLSRPCAEGAHSRSPSRGEG